MSVSLTDVANVHPDEADDPVGNARRLLIWVIRFVMPVFVLFTLADLNNLSLLDRAALAICPLTWLLMERAMRGESLGRG